MLRILRDKFVRLGKDEDGAVLIVTLALFMFMYLSCAGVFSMGRLAKVRIHLQNACDAAAYSAAVVQADTLSRIATINRAMAWTYVSMTRRQMDVVTYRWLEETAKHWRDDRDRAKDWADSTIHPTPAICSLAALPVGGHLRTDHSFAVPTLPWITLYKAKGSAYASEAEISVQDGLFEMTHVGSGSSFYSSPMPGIDSMVAQIHDDYNTVRQMSEKIDELKGSYKGRAEEAVEHVLKANLSAMQGRSISEDVFFFRGIADMDEYVEVLPNNEDNESRFLSYVDESLESAFGDSGEVWFKRCGSPGRGFRRGYDWGGDRLRAEWEWYSNQWHCETDPVSGEKHIGPFPCPSCTHGSHDRCSCTSYGLFFKAKVFGDNSKSVSGYRDIYETPVQYVARPNWVVEDFFGAAGTITVGLACRNENPWYRILGTPAEVARGMLGGIYGAFNPYRNVDWTWAFSSAKAGYKFKGESLDRRDYMVHWNKDNQDWNLCQSDWDAVFVPVRRATSKATEGKMTSRTWSYADSAPLGDWINGDWEPLGSGSWGVVASMPDLPGMNGSGGAGGLKWNRLADMLYH